MRICALVANFTHSVIVTSNFVCSEYTGSKILFITERKQKENLARIVENYFKNESVSYIEWLDEMNNYDCLEEDVIFAIYGSDMFISKVNNYIKNIKISNVIIDLYEITNIKENIENIINSYEYFLNSNGLQVKKR